MKKYRIILYQKPLGIPISKKDVNEIKKYKPHFICFPEYFFVNKNLGNNNQTNHNQLLQIKRIKTLSIEINTVVIGGTMPEISGKNLFNTTYVYYNGNQLGFYRKKHLYYMEEGIMTPGNDYKIFSAYGINFGVLICADVFYESSFKFMNNHNTKIIFSPTFSPFKNETIEEKYKRDREIYIKGASVSNSVIVKVCGVKSEYKNFLQARSLIADSTKIIYRVKPEEEHTSMIIKKEIEV